VEGEGPRYVMSHRGLVCSRAAEDMYVYSVDSVVTISVAAIDRPVVCCGGFHLGFVMGGQSKVVH